MDVNDIYPAEKQLGWRLIIDKCLCEDNRKANTCSCWAVFGYWVEGGEGKKEGCADPRRVLADLPM